MGIVKRPISPAQKAKAFDDFINGAPDAVKAAPVAMATPAAAADAPAPKTRVMKGKQAQITLTIPVDLLERAHAMADHLSISRAAFMKMAITRAVEAEGS